MTIRNLQHIALTVPDATVGRKFYTDFGMDAREENRRIVMRCHGRDQDQVVLVEGKKKQMHHVAFGSRAADVAGVKQRLERN
ncbi:MAG TPA: VOC family protein, partial [Candidatus Polarisedimenticolia bacterium]|nr:VOC family protein [Candidatus Polarisedimenticolia bacterium]